MRRWGAVTLGVMAALAVWPAETPAADVPGVPAGLDKCTRGSAAYCGSVTVPLDRTGATPGTLAIRFEYYPRTDTSRPPLSTIVAHEGGPGYSTTDSRDYYLDLFRPLMTRRALLLVDERGTGLSGAINCPEAESYDGNWVANAAACAARLGAGSDLYTSAAAADDMAAVLHRLGTGPVDLYGDSYGSFFAQTFAVRHPQLLRSLILDGTYPIEGLDPWYRTTARRLRDNLELVCARSLATCPTTPANMVHLTGQVIDRLRAHPLTTTAPDAYGAEVTVTLTPTRFLDTLLYTDVTPGYLREYPAAAVAFLAGDVRPLARMVAEVNGPSGDTSAGRSHPQPNSSLRGYSEGAYLAYSCNDYPTVWDTSAPNAVRDLQYRNALSALAPGSFGPWSNTEWARSDFFVYDYCIHWPAPRVAQPPFPPGGHYPNVPTLVMNGDLDLRTDLYQAREVAANFPNSTYLEVPNFGHVTALYDADRCTSVIARRFVSSLAAGDTSCVRRISEHRLVKRFAGHAADAPQAAVAGTADRSTARDRRAAYVAVEALADVIDRWYAIPGYTGVGLYGGQFTMTTTTSGPFVSRTWTLKLNHLRWTSDIAVTGGGTMPRAAGTATMTVKLGGAATATGSLTISWPTRAADAVAHITGSIGGRPVRLSAPAPSYY